MIEQIIIRLNQNQGVIATITILITLVGFIFTNRNIYNKIKQNQKSGNNSTNTQIGNINNQNKNE